MSAVSEKQEGKTASTVSQKQQRTDLKGLNILVVDDSDELREILEFILKSKGATVDPASDGAEAMKKATTMKYDLILMDMRMPGLDGNDTAMKIRESCSNIKIIALTGDVDAEKFLRTGSPFNAYIPKPIDPANLSVSILKTINS